MQKIRGKTLVLFIIIFLYPLFITLRQLYLGTVPFWLDPARDLLLAKANLEKLSLIGQPSGIPNVLYGPYWIWWLSSIELISKDPRIIMLFALVIPYFTIFPYLLSRFTPVIGIRPAILMWLLFFLGYNNYTTNLWHPYLSPIMILLLIYLLIFRSSKNNWPTFFAGITAGLLVNVHFSLGFQIIVAALIFLFADGLVFTHMPIQKRVIFLFRQLLFFGAGLTTIFLPTIFFEYRHGFTQIRSLAGAIQDSVLYNSPAVGQIGLEKPLLLQIFFGKIMEVLGLPGVSFLWELLLIIFVAIYLVKQRNKLTWSIPQKRLLLFLFCSIAVIVWVMMTNKNPVWGYYFIGTETLMLLLIGVMLKQIPTLQPILTVWVCIQLFINILTFFRTLPENPRLISSLATKQAIVEQIFADAGSQPIAIFTYSPAIITYDYDYLIWWLGGKYNITTMTPEGATALYLIIPKEASEAVAEDFIHYKTPDEQYQTLATWKHEDGTQTIKRVSTN